MKRKFCPSCGKSVNRLYSGLCKACLMKKIEVKLPETLKVAFCKKCGKLIGGSEYLERSLKKNIRVKNCKLDNIKLISMKDDVAEFSIKLKIGNLKKTKKIKVKIKTKKRYCETCSKVKGGYYEAVIQLRSDTKIDDSAVKRVLNIIEREGGFVTKIERKRGIDIYFTPKNILNRVIRKIPEVKEIKKSYTLITKKDGKDIYRHTVLIRL